MKQRMSSESYAAIERALWRQRLKYAGVAVGLALVAAGAAWFTSLDATDQKSMVAGVVEQVGPVRSSVRQPGGAEALAVDVRLVSGRLVHVQTTRETDPHVGDKVTIAEHKHGSGRTTYSWR